MSEKSFNDKKLLKKSTVLFFFGFITLFFLGIIVYSLRTKNGPSISPYPDGKNFAFTITADPDGNRLEKDRLIYDLFTEVGLRTTIALWVKEPSRSTAFPDLPIPHKNGDSCERDGYLKYMQELQKRGFEIVLHTVSSGNDYREETIKGYELFKDYFGAYPNINIMHSTNLENVYWGKKVVDNGLIRYFVSLFADRANILYSGEISQSKYFWGDILKQKTKYVRLWGTSDINTLKFNPSMPYHNPKKPFVNYWFSFTDGRDLEIFNKMLSKENIKRLVKERGASIVYVHFNGFVSNGKLNGTFTNRIKTLTQQKDGWFVPATTLLDRLLLMKEVKIKISNNAFYVTNFNSCNVDGVTLLVQPNGVLYNGKGIPMKANEEGEIILESMKPGETYILLRDRKFMSPKNEYPTSLEKLNMILQRTLVYIKHNG
jgi:hypothetical protein